MRRKIIGLILATTALPGAAALAADTRALINDAPLSTTASMQEVTRGYLRDETIGIKPQAGVIAYRDQLGATTSRFLGGLTADLNILPIFNKDIKSWYIGVGSGALFSHLGDPGSSILGANSDTLVGSAGANLLLIPINGKVGFNFTDTFRLSAHGGANVVYRSVANSINLGSANSIGTGSNWSMFPNVGADAEFGISKNLSVMLRPDITFTPGDVLFVGTVALGIPLG